MSYSRGSIWRRCDLHIHTPESHLSNEFGSDWDNYVKRMITEAVVNEVEIIGITDYFTIDGYKRLFNDYLSKPDRMKELFSDNIDVYEKSKSILFLPNIEFRLNKLVGGNRVNFHVIFSDEVSINDIEENFLHDLSFVYQADPYRPDMKMKLKMCNLESLGKTLKEHHEKFTQSDIITGMMNAVVDDSEIMEGLNNDRFLNKYLIAVPCDEDLSSISWDGQDHNVRKVIVQKSNLIFSSNSNTRRWGLGEFNDSKEDYIKEFKSLKPCFHGSDAHRYEKLFKPDYDKLCWIKADSTFEGLKQVVYEPDERVRISTKNPNYQYEKPYFESIQISEDSLLFEDDELKLKKADKIPLNKNLVSIIGGRGSGKSMLLNVISNVFGDSDLKDLNSIDNLSINFAKNNTKKPEIIEFSGNQENSLNYLFISQGHVKKLLLDPKKYSEDIGDLLELDVQNISQEIQNDLVEINMEIDGINIWFDKEDEENNLINQEKYNESVIKSNKHLLSNITTEDNAEKLKNYSTNIENIHKYEEDNILLEEFIEDLNAYLRKSNIKIESFSDRYKIPKIDFELQLSKIKSIIEGNKSNIDCLKNENLSIKEAFTEFYTGDLVTLLSNVDKYKKNIADAQKQIHQINEKKEILTEKSKIRKELCEILREEYELQSKSITTKWQKITDKFDDQEHKRLIKKILSDREIDIYGEVKFDKNEFVEGLKNNLNLTQYRNTTDITQEDKILADFPIKDHNDFFDFMSCKLDVFVDNIENSTKIRNYEGLINWFYDHLNRSKYLYTIPIIEYKGKTIEKLSAGQKGTVYLCIKLATNAFSTPIIFDQPEDDLDNEFIIEELISIIIELKRYRQIIIATHNANLVVNADSEQIIIANNIDEVLSYKSGSIENKEIVENVCKILEGGRSAFNKRTSKYSQFI